MGTWVPNTLHLPGLDIDLESTGLILKSTCGECLVHGGNTEFPLHGLPLQTPTSSTTRAGNLKQLSIGFRLAAKHLEKLADQWDEDA